jgi:UDP-glucose 4-epimerase
VAGEPLTVFGNGHQTRCFCHVGDVVDGMLRLFDDPRAVGQAFNIGSQEEVSILELAERVGSRVDGAAPIELVPYEDAYPVGFEDMRRRVPDTTKIHEFTGWHVTKSLDEILDEAVAEARAEREAVFAGGLTAPGAASA